MTLWGNLQVLWIRQPGWGVTFTFQPSQDRQLVDTDHTFRRWLDRLSQTHPTHRPSQKLRTGVCKCA